MSILMYSGARCSIAENGKLPELLRSYVYQTIYLTRCQSKSAASKKRYSFLFMYIYIYFVRPCQKDTPLTVMAHSDTIDTQVIKFSELFNVEVILTQ